MIDFLTTLRETKMSITTEEQQYDYFLERVDKIVKEKLLAKTILTQIAFVSKQELVQALVNGSATLNRDFQDMSGNALYVGDLDWPDFTDRAEHAIKMNEQARDAYIDYKLSLDKKVLKIKDQVVLGKLKPLDAIEQIEKLD